MYDGDNLLELQADAEPSIFGRNLARKIFGEKNDCKLQSYSKRCLGLKDDWWIKEVKLMSMLKEYSIHYFESIVCSKYDLS